MTTEDKNCEVSALQVAELTREDLEASALPEERYRFARKLQHEASLLAHSQAETIAQEARALLEVAERELDSLAHEKAG